MSKWKRTEQYKGYISFSSSKRVNAMIFFRKIARKLIVVKVKKLKNGDWSHTTVKYLPNDLSRVKNPKGINYRKVEGYLKIRLMER